MTNINSESFVLQTSTGPDVFENRSAEPNGAMAEQPGTSIGFTSDSRVPTAEMHRHWIVADPVIIQILVQRADIEVHCVAHDDDLDHPHYHVYFSQYKKGKQPDVKTLVTYIRARLGCEHDIKTYGKNKKAFARPCRLQKNPRRCPACGFFIKYTKPITTSRHARNVFRYIAGKTNSAYHEKDAALLADTELEITDRQIEEYDLEPRWDSDDDSADSY